jgi:hypothetical protein
MTPPRGVPHRFGITLRRPESRSSFTLGARNHALMRRHTLPSLTRLATCRRSGQIGIKLKELDRFAPTAETFPLSSASLTLANT